MREVFAKAVDVVVKGLAVSGADHLAVFVFYGEKIHGNFSFYAVDANSLNNLGVALCTGKFGKGNISCDDFFFFFKDRGLLFPNAEHGFFHYHVGDHVNRREHSAVLSLADGKSFVGKVVAFEFKEEVGLLFGLVEVLKCFFFSAFLQKCDLFFDQLFGCDHAERSEKDDNANRSKRQGSGNPSHGGD